MGIHNIQKWSDDLYILGYRDTTEADSVQFFHAHAGLEILFIHEGLGRCILEDEIFTIKPNTLIIYKPYQLHYLKIEVPPTYIRSKLKVKESLIELLKLVFPLHYDNIFQLWSGKFKAPVFYLTDQQAAQIDEQLIQLCKTVKAGNRPFTKESVLEFILFFFTYVQRNLLSERDGSEQIANSKNQHVNRILSWINQHYKEDFRVEKMADALHLTPNYLSTLFRQQTGRSLLEYIAERRLELARTLLVDPEYSINHICREVGFRSPSYFIQQFRKKYNVTPNQYRKKIMTLYFEN